MKWPFDLDPLQQKVSVPIFWVGILGIDIVVKVRHSEGVGSATGLESGFMDFGLGRRLGQFDAGNLLPVPADCHFHRLGTGLFTCGFDS